MMQIKKILVEETFLLRLEVLRKNIPLPYKFNGDFDEQTFHLGVFENNKLIAVSSFMKVNNNNFEGEHYQLRGMATLSKFQGKGAGRLMMIEAFKILKQKKVDILWCNARIIAVPFYQKVGMCIVGENFNIPHIGLHCSMFKKIA